ncbi:MAG: hypothetical protein LC657_16210 [Desulfobacteraceae bacterium]|nr:hypothetical protein [Desulfobacteraceae bacterium]
MLFCLAFLLAYLIRFEFVLKQNMVEQILALLPMVLGIKAVSFFAMQLYKGMFRYAGLVDLWRLVKAVGVSSLVLITAMIMLNRFEGYSRTVFVVDGALTLLLAGGFRLLIRYIFKHYGDSGEGSSGVSFSRINLEKKIPVLIYGAGNAGEKLFREISENRRLRYRVVGFGDDDPHKTGRTIHILKKSQIISMKKWCWSPGPGAVSAVSCAGR